MFAETGRRKVGQYRPTALTKQRKLNLNFSRTKRKGKIFRICLTMKHDLCKFLLTLMRCEIEFEMKDILACKLIIVSCRKFN
jgi:hypothetical protein